MESKSAQKQGRELNVIKTLQPSRLFNLGEKIEILFLVPFWHAEDTKEQWTII